MTKQNDNEMSREERGRMGGEEKSRNHEKEFYQEIDRKGGSETSDNHDKDFYSETGRQGGEAKNEKDKNSTNSRGRTSNN